MDHTENVLKEMLESLFAVDSIEQSNDQSLEEKKENFNQIPSLDSPTDSFIEDINEFFNINQNRCNDKNRMREMENQITFKDTEQKIDGQTSKCAPKNFQNLTIAEELKKMHMEFPINSEEFSKKKGMESYSNPPKETYSPRDDYYQNEEQSEDVIQQISSTDFFKKADIKAFLDEIKRVLYEDTNENFPKYNSPEYFDVAQEYAVFGNYFLDFPQDFDAIIKQVKANKKPIIQYVVTPSSSDEEIVPSAISIIEPPKSSSKSTNIFQKQLNGVAATAATNNQFCRNIQPALRSAAAATAVAVNASNSAYNMLLHNKVTYSANGTHNVPPQQVFYNQQQLSTTTTKYYANQTAIGNAANVRFPNPVVATNTFVKETQYVANMPVPNSAGITNGYVFERLVYSQILQQKIFQTLQQQQAMVSAVMYQQQQQLQQQYQQIKIATSLQSTAINVAGNINSNTRGFTGSVESSNTMVSLSNCTHSSSVYSCTTYDKNNVDLQ